MITTRIRKISSVLKDLFPLGGPAHVGSAYDKDLGVLALQPDHDPAARRYLGVAQVATTPTDAAFPTVPPFGTLAIDTVAGILYVKTATGWEAITSA